MAVKASKEIRELVYKLCNGIRREKDICEYLIHHHNGFSDTKETEIAVAYHLDKLKAQGLIHFKYNGRIIDLQR